MPPNPDETDLGEQLVTAGKLSREQLQTCLDLQHPPGSHETRTLSEILVERGHMSPLELESTLIEQRIETLWCSQCRLMSKAASKATDVPHACQECGWPLEPAPAPRDALVRMGGPGAPLADDDTENLPEEVRQALADPKRRIGRYAKVEELGRGGMGVVHRCYDPHLHRHVAIKTILETRADPESLARFEREARAAAKIHHPGIVKLLGVGQHEGHPYLVMDFVEGETLGVLLEREQLTAHRIAEIIRRVARAISHAHDAGIIHRDIKPQNIMIDTQGRPSIMDFGLARDTSARRQLTQTGQIMGTPAYMAPEQADNSVGEHGPWTDVYAMGAVLYRALTGQTVFEASSPSALIMMILRDEPEPLRNIDPTINPDLETIALKCLEKSPHRRYRAATEVSDELQRFLDGEAILARPIGPAERAYRWLQRNPVLATATTVVVVVVMFSTGVVLRQASTARQRQEDLRLATETQRAKLRKNEEEDSYRQRMQRELAHRERNKRKSALAARQEQGRRAAAAREKLRIEVMAVLDRVRPGEVLRDLNDCKIERSRILRHHDIETVGLLAAELDALSNHLAESRSLGENQELFLHFLCDTLADLSIREGAVPTLGRYLRAELALKEASRNQLRAVPAGKALCLLGGSGADRLLIEARDGFGANAGFWEQVLPLYRRTGMEPSLEPTSALDYYKIAVARADNGNADDAITSYSRAIEIDPTMADAWFGRGKARKASGDSDGAMEDYSHAIEIDPTRADAWFSRGILRRAKGDLDGAVEDYTRTTEIDPEYLTAWYNRGNTRLVQGELDGAIEDYSRAIEIDSQFAQAYCNRGDAKQTKGDLDGAIADWQRFLELAPYHDAAPAIRVELEKARAQRAEGGAGR